MSAEFAFDPVNRLLSSFRMAFPPTDGFRGQAGSSVLGRLAGGLPLGPDHARPQHQSRTRCVSSL